MNQPNIRPAGVPGGGRPGVPSGTPGADLRGPDTERLLAGVEADLDSVDEKSTQDQVPVFDRIHTALADALARTADTGGSPGSGQLGSGQQGSGQQGSGQQGSGQQGSGQQGSGQQGSGQQGA